MNAGPCLLRPIFGIKYTKSVRITVSVREKGFDQMMRADIHLLALPVGVILGQECSVLSPSRVPKAPTSTRSAH